MTDDSGYERLWSGIEGCTACRVSSAFEGALQGHAFVPMRGLPPKWPVTYMIVCLEPSISWAGDDQDTAKALLNNGYRNFNNSREDLCFQYAIESWLLAPGEGYVITDLAKCALPTSVARSTRSHRYETCQGFLLEELDLFKPKAAIAVGKDARTSLDALRLSAPSTMPMVFDVLHYSRVAVGHRAKYLDENWRAGVPTLAAFAEWCGERRSITYQPAGQVKTPSDAHLQLLAVYRRQFGDIRRQLLTPI